MDLVTEFMEPGFYQSDQFTYLLALLALFVLWLVYRLRIRRLVRRSANLEAEVREQEVELERQADALAKANQELSVLVAQLRAQSGELEAAKTRAEEASRAKSEFLARMSHELRTPLTSVIGFTNVLMKNKAGNLREQDLVYLERIGANARHLLGLINAILDLSKIEAGKVELHLAPVSLELLVRETLAQLEGRAAMGNVELRASVPERLAPLTTDAGKLKQVLINLVGNALNFTEEGSVTVAVAANPATGVPDRIEVIDTGVGMSQDRLSTIFEAFEQADSGPARKYGGTGLGLAITRSLCQLMGYRLEVESELGKGSTFRILLAPPVPEGAAGEAVAAGGRAG